MTWKTKPLAERDPDEIDLVKQLISLSEDRKAQTQQFKFYEAQTKLLKEAVLKATEKMDEVVPVDEIKEIKSIVKDNNLYVGRLTDQLEDINCVIDEIKNELQTPWYKKLWKKQRKKSQRQEH